MNKPLAYERQVLRADHRFMLWLWRRQGRKTTNMAKLALKKMMKRPGRLVTFASASILVGREMLIKEAQVLQSAFAEWKSGVDKAGMKMETNADGLTPDDFCELFEKGRIEAKIWHSKTVFSRTLVIAPNVATARGFSGDVMIDEIGFIPDFKDLWEAMEPIASSDPDFSVLMATTPPNDDAHYSYELSVPPEGMLFPQCADGHWYDSQANVKCHRVDVYDAAAAGLKLYDLNTRAEITPAEHRLKALDREAWDRNYALIFKSGGTAAVSLMSLHTAMLKGREACLFAEDDLPEGWTDFIGTGKLALGLDLATTEKESSNPSALAIAEQVGNEFFARLELIWKTADPAVTRAIIREVLAQLKGRVRRLSIDATNERFFATDLKKEFSASVIVELVIASENTEYGGQKMSMKSYLGNLLVNTLEDAHLTLPDSRYIKEDFRLVVKNRGGFDATVDSSGRHGDTFDSTKLALHGLISRSGPAMAEAVSVGTFTRAPKVNRWKNPFARQSDNLGVKSHV